MRDLLLKSTFPAISPTLYHQVILFFFNTYQTFTRKSWDDSHVVHHLKDHWGISLALASSGKAFYY